MTFGTIASCGSSIVLVKGKEYYLSCRECLWVTMELTELRNLLPDLAAW
jgi:hypothetical protein